MGTRTTRWWRASPSDDRPPSGCLEGDLARGPPSQQAKTAPGGSGDHQGNLGGPRPLLREPTFFLAHHIPLHDEFALLGGRDERGEETNGLAGVDDPAYR